jgi:hypothetical protein
VRRPRRSSIARSSSTSIRNGCAGSTATAG